MKSLRREERWAQLVIEKALGLPVRQHDDGSAPSMHDLDIVYPNERAGAVEITAAADPTTIELWNLMNGSDERWLEAGVRGGWMVSVFPNARAKTLKSELPALLAELERREIGELPSPKGKRRTH